MNEPQDPKLPDRFFGFDDVQGFDVEIIPCQEGIDAVLAWAAAQVKPAGAARQSPDTHVLPGEDPGRPAT
jgi:hypothetical protein